IKINTYKNVSVSNNIFATAEKVNRKKLIMYSTTWCGVCKKAKKYFLKNNIAFTEYDVENNSKGKRDYKKMKGRGVPIFLIGSKRLNGFDEAKFNQIYGANSQ
ncbi:MAG: glutaredoxin family protein, partial [Gammaproteobacteria bacterium]